MFIDFEGFKASPRLQTLTSENAFIKEHMNTLETRIHNRPENYCMSKHDKGITNEINNLIKLESKSITLWEQALTKAINECPFTVDESKRDYLLAEIDDIDREMRTFLATNVNKKKLTDTKEGKEIASFERFRKIFIVMVLLSFVLQFYMIIKNNKDYSLTPILSVGLLIVGGVLISQILDDFNSCYTASSILIDIEDLNYSFFLISIFSVFTLNPLFIISSVLAFFVTKRKIHSLKNADDYVKKEKIRNRISYRINNLIYYNIPEELRERILLVAYELDNINEETNTPQEELLENVNDYLNIISKKGKKFHVC